MNESTLDTPAAASSAAVPRSARGAVRWILWSLPGLPVAVLVHELAHFLFYRAFGFPGLRLHFAAVSHDLHPRFWTLVRSGERAAAAEIAPFWQVGLASGSAILVSYATILGAAYLTRRHGPHPFVVAVGLTATLRFQIGLSILHDHLVAGERYFSGTDEGLTAAMTGIPEVLLWFAGLSIAVAGWVLIVRGLTPGRRWRELGLVALGAAAGAVLYVGFVGPWLLPA